MKIFNDTKELVKIEKEYTAKILANLKVIEEQKLYADLKYPSLHKYIVRELKYSDAEASIRVNAVRLILKSKKAEQKIERGDLNTTNAAHANRALQGCKDDKKKNDSGFVDKLIDEASSKSTRDFNKYLDKEFKRPRKETVTFDEGTLDKFDRLRKEYGDLTTYELIQILLEEKLKAPGAPRRHQHVAGFTLPVQLLGS